MKTFITLAFMLFLLQPVMAADNPPEEWIVAKFKHDFPNSSQVKWSEHETRYEVCFIKDGIDCRLFISKTDGSDYALIRYYHEEELTPVVREKLHNFLPHASIYGVTEVDMNNKTGYQIIMKNTKHMYVIEVDSNKNIGLEKVLKNN